MPRFPTKLGLRFICVRTHAVALSLGMGWSRLFFLADVPGEPLLVVLLVAPKGRQPYDETVRRLGEKKNTAACNVSVIKQPHMTPRGSGGPRGGIHPSTALAGVRMHLEMGIVHLLLS